MESKNMESDWWNFDNSVINFRFNSTEKGPI